MKLAVKLKSVCEKLDSSQLNKFWSAIEEHSLKLTDKNIRENSLLLAPDSAFFERISTPYDGEHAVEKSLTPIFEVKPLKDLLSFVFNEYVADEASTDVEDDELLEYFLKNIKGKTAGFAGSVEVIEHATNDERSGSASSYYVEGLLVIKNFDYDKNKDAFVVTDADVKDLTKVEQD